MSYIIAAALGLVFGFTDILPLSGPGHFYLLFDFLHISLSNNDLALFEGLIKFGTAFTVFIVFFGDISDMLRQTLKLVINGVEDNDGYVRRLPSKVRLTFMLCISLLPVIISSFLIRNDSLRRNRLFISIAVIITGVILFLSCMAPKGKKGPKTMTVSDSLIMGIGYGVSMLPGLSHSALVMSAGSCCGVKKLFSVRYCMLLYFPCTLISSLLKIISALFGSVSKSLLPVFAVAFVTSSIGALIALALYNKVVKKKNILFCSYYCMIIGVITLILGFIIK